MITFGFVSATTVAIVTVSKLITFSQLWVSSTGKIPVSYENNVLSQYILNFAFCRPQVSWTKHVQFKVIKTIEFIVLNFKGIDVMEKNAVPKELCNRKPNDAE